MRTHWILGPLMVFVLALDFCSGIASADNDPSARIGIDAPDQKCVADEDCVPIRTRCLPCECDAAVHRDYTIKYQQLLAESCAQFPAAMACEIPCKTSIPRCVEGECSLAEQ